MILRIWRSLLSELRVAADAGGRADETGVGGTLERRAGEGLSFSGVFVCPFPSLVMGDVDDSGEFGRPNIPYVRLMQ